VVVTAVLPRRALNRALLARQYLLASADVPAQIAIEHLVGLQSQAPNPPYIGLWTRVAGFEFDELAQLIRDRKVARLALMRGTIHLVTAADAHRIRPLVQPVLDRGFRSSSYARAVRGLDVAGVAAAGQAAVERTPLSFTELGEVLRQAWPDRDATALAQVVRAYVALIQVPPRGIWGEVGQARHTSILAWLGQPPDSSLSTVDDLVLRYLGAFGPASTADIQTWSGLTRLGEVVERLRPRLATFRDEDHVELVDLPDGPRPGPDLPAPVRFLPEWDNILLSHADRNRIISDESRARIATKNGVVPGSVLIDGSVGATWRLVRNRDSTILTITPFTKLPSRDQTAVLAEGERLVAVVASGAPARHVALEAPAP
jgi:winged helix DNA-binding protein